MTDSDSDNEISPIIISRNNFTILYEKDEKTQLIKISFRELIYYTSNWIYNRTIDNKKVQELLEQLEKSADYYNIGWVLHAFKDKSNNSIKLLDGQHRREAIRLYLEKYDMNMTDNNEIIIWLYTFDNELLREKEIIELFRIINNNKAFDENQLPSQRKINLINLIKEHPKLKNGIKCDPRRNISHSPYIHIKELKGIIDKILVVYEYLTNEEIINRLQYINHRISLLTPEEKWKNLFGKKEMTDKRINIINKCHKIQFYLNIKDSKYQYEEWIKYFNDTDKII